MTSSSTPTTVDLREPGELLAATPALLGFRPSDSVLVLGHRAPTGTRIGTVLRADLPAPGDERDLSLRLREALLPDSVAATLVVVGGRPAPVVPQPRADDADVSHSAAPGPAVRAVVAALTDAVTELGVRVPHALWVDEIRAGARWQCLDTDPCTGRLPDPGSSVLAAVTAHQGWVTYSSREALRAQLEPDGGDALARRSALLAARTRADPADADDVARGRAVVRAALDRSRHGDPAPSDDDVVELASALATPLVRDACLATALPPGTPGAVAAERLWLTLTRRTPSPERARPATLLGYSAYVRGDGAFAGMALALAREADPDHLLAQLLTQALDHAVPPETLARLGTTADADPLGLPLSAELSDSPSGDERPSGREPGRRGGGGRDHGHRHHHADGPGGQDRVRRTPPPDDPG